MAYSSVSAFLCRMIVAMSLVALSVNAGSAQDLRREIEGVVQEYIQRNPQAIQQIVKDYLAANPEILQQVITDALKRQRSAPDVPVAARQPVATPDKVAIIRDNADAIFNSPHQMTFGNLQGDVTLVEFFDYACGFCKRALSDKLDLMKGDPKLRVVLKEFPILGPNSLAASRVAIAVRMQDSGGSKALEFHKQLLGDRMPPTRERAMTIARGLGLNVALIERDEGSKEVEETLQENARLARALGINGTPSYVVGDNVIIGAVGLLPLKMRIDAARQ